MPSAAIQPLQTILFQVTQKLDGQVVMTTWPYYVQASGSPPGCSLADMLALFDSHVWDTGAFGLRYLQCDTVTDTLLTGQIILGPGSRSRMEFRSPLHTTGMNALTPLPTGAAAVVKRYGSAAGRHFQGRIYIPGIPQDWVLASEFTADYTNPVGDAIAGWIQSLTIGPVGNQYLARPCIHAVGTPPSLDQIGVTYETTTPVRYQRRREVGVGQ